MGSPLKPTGITGYVDENRQSGRFDRLQPASQHRTNSALKHQLLPTFGDMPVDRIGRREVTNRFDRYSETVPGCANRALGTLCQVLNHAELHGHLQTNTRQAEFAETRYARSTGSYHRMPFQRDPDTQMMRGRHRLSQSRRQQDGSANSVSQQQGKGLTDQQSRTGSAYVAREPLRQEGTRARPRHPLPTGSGDRDAT